MKIVIINAYCYLNKGDAGIIITMVKEFKNKYPNCNISVVSMFPKIDQGKYGNCKVIGPVIKPYNGKNRYFKVIRNVFLYLLFSITNKLGLNINGSINEIKAADLVVSCGGGFFQSKNIKYFLSAFLYHLIQMNVAIQCNRDLIIYAQTIGKFSENKFIMRQVKKVLKSAKLIMVRESITYNYLKTLLGGCPKNCYQTGDIAFLLKRREINIKKLFPISKYQVGITVREWHFPGQPNRSILRKNYVQSIVKLIEYLSKKENISIYLLPQVIGPGRDNDLIISREIYSQLSQKNNVYKVEEDFEPPELKYVYSQLDLLVGTRMHSNIFALSEGTPCVAISYDSKTNGIMADLGLSNYVLDINELQSKELIEKVNDAINNLDDLKNYLSLNIQNMIDRSKRNNELLFHYIDKKYS